MIKYIISGITFTSKDAIKKHVQAIIARHKINDTLEGTDLEFMLALFRQHSNAEQKFGVGIRKIYITNNQYKTKALEISRIDGSWTDISWVHCITPRTKKQEVTSAFRRAVADQVIEFKEATFNTNKPLICPLDGTPITKKTAHIDHADPYPFDMLVKLFCENEGINLLDIEIGGHEDTEQDRFIKDEALRQLWWVFHKKHAILRAVNRRPHLAGWR